MMSATPGATPAHLSKTGKKRSRGKKSVGEASLSGQDKPGSNVPGSPIDGPTTAAPEPKDEKKFMVELAKRVRKSTKKLESIEKDQEKIKDLSPEEQRTTSLLNKDQLKKIDQKPITQAVHNELIELNRLYLEQQTILQDIEAERTKEFEEKLAAEVNKAREEGREEGRTEVEHEAKDKVTSLLKFLRLAGYRRSIPSESPEDNQAIESLLILLYSGDDVALIASNKLAEGSIEMVDESLTVTYKHLKQLAYDLRMDDEAEPETEQTPTDPEHVAKAQPEQQLETSTEESLSKESETVTEPRTNGTPQSEAPAITSAVSEPASEDTGSATVQNADDGVTVEASASETPVPNVVTESTEASVEQPGDGTGSVHKAEETANKSASETSARSKDDDFVHVEHRRGRGGRGGHRGDRDGHFRGRGRGGYRGDRRGERGRGGPYRGRGGRGRGGDHQVQAPVAAPPS